jgi:PPM family protein phosphatase
MTTKLKGAWVTHVGNKKPDNEDSVFFGKACVCGRSMNEPEAVELDGTHWLLGVADGVGGHNAGETASRLCSEAAIGIEEVSRAKVDSLLQNLNKEIFDKSVEDETLSGMGTTVAGVALGGGGLFAFNVGDSRVYRFHEERGLERVTLDDSLLERGDAKTGTPMPFAPSNVITQALGGRKSYKEITPNLYDLETGEEVLYLVCSDGLNDMVEDVRMEEILRETDASSNLEKATGALLAAALDGGGRDNVSIVLAAYSPENFAGASKGGSWLSRLFGRTQR